MSVHIASALDLFSSMVSSRKKVIAVMGATGQQGGAVIQAFHKLGDNNPYEIIAISRDPESEKAKALAPMVKEVVKADPNDEEEMTAAFTGCYGAFVVTTTSYQKDDTKKEMETTRTIMRAAKATGLKHVVLSTLDDCTKMINEAENKDTWKLVDEELNMYVPHFDGKGQVAAEFAEEVPTTRLLTTFFVDNFATMTPPTRQSNKDPYTITFPMGDKKLCMASVSDIGKVACAILLDSSFVGRQTGVMTAALPCQEIADMFTKVCEVPVKYNDMPLKDYAALGFPGAADFANMFRFYAEFEEHMVQTRTVDEALKKTIDEKLGGLDDFEAFLTANKETYKLEPPEPEEDKPKARPEAPMPVTAGGGGCCAIL